MPNGVRHSTLAFPLRQQEGIRGGIFNDEHYYSEKPIMGSDASNRPSSLSAWLSDKPSVYNSDCDAIAKAFQNGTVNAELGSLLFGLKGCFSDNEQEPELPSDPKPDDEKQPQGNRKPCGKYGQGVINPKDGKCYDLKGNPLR